MRHVEECLAMHIFRPKRAKHTEDQIFLKKSDLHKTVVHYNAKQKQSFKRTQIQPSKIHKQSTTALSLTTYFYRYCTPQQAKMLKMEALLIPRVNKQPIVNEHNTFMNLIVGAL